MSEPLPANLPPRNTLAQSTQRYISLLETQLSIAYPTENLEHSSQLNRDPVLKLVVSLIIVISNRSCPSGEDYSQLLDEWLHFGLYELPSLHDYKEMVRDRSFLERLYQRGIVNFFLPVLALEELKEDYICLDVPIGFTTLELKGTGCQIIFIKTPPISKCKLTVTFTVDKNLKYSTTHRVQFMINHPKVFPENTEKVDSIEGSVWHPLPHCCPLHVLVINARGAIHPHFNHIFAQKTSELQPDVVIVTETRLEALNTLEPRQSIHFDSSLTIESPLNFFGGTWFLWNSFNVAVQPVHRRKQLLGTEINLPN
ncbi:hypothetical protein COLO4_03499 [Corchorus olitorius]|uniref:Endonuclease/exonuclease/phosphatase n=1 Tax=Corchorus olitorius TaxID=93759 RepID=A0A1R3KYD2_9ROSI|nr:hypothetical protein COLO4_03499 [Corchorus olitorius]